MFVEVCVLSDAEHVLSVITKLLVHFIGTCDDLGIVVLPLQCL